MIGTSDKGKESPGGGGGVHGAETFPPTIPVKIPKWSTANQVLKFSKTEIVFFFLDL